MPAEKNTLDETGKTKKQIELKWVLQDGRLSIHAQTGTLFSLENMSGSVVLDGNPCFLTDSVAAESSATQAEFRFAGGMRWTWALREADDALELVAALRNESDKPVRIGDWNILHGRPEQGGGLVLGESPETVRFFRWIPWNTGVETFAADGNFRSTTLCHLFDPATKLTARIAFVTLDRLNCEHSIRYEKQSAGGVEYVFAGSGSLATSAVIVPSGGSTVGFSALAGQTTNYSIYKDGAAAGFGDLRQYDVATYSSATNTIRVCDTRLTGYYEGASPNLSAPEKITVLGQSFTVLASAYDTLSQFKLGDRITLLLTEDNQVAGALAAGASGAAQGNALGIVTSLTASSATVNLLSGLTITGKVDLSDTSVAQMSGQLVRVSAGSKGYLAISQVTGGVSGSLDVAGRKLGTASLRDNVVIYQQSGGTLTSTSLSQLQYGTIPSSGIVCAVTDWAGRVSILVLGNAAGAQYRYGLSEMNATTEEDEDGQKITTRYLTLHTPAKDYGPIATGYDIPSGAFIGVSMNADQSRITGYPSLTKLGGVSNSAWIGETAVTAGGRTCTVPTDVLCYNRASGTWVTLGQAHAFSSVSSLYVDSYNVVRVVEVGQ